MALRNTAKKAAGRAAEPNVSRQPGLGSLMNSAAAGGLSAAQAAQAANAPRAAGRYTADDISAIIRGRGAIPLSQDLGDRLFDTLGIAKDQRWAEGPMNEGGTPGSPMDFSQAGRDALRGFTFDWNPEGNRVENGWLTAYRPDGTEAARLFQSYGGETKATLEAAALAAAGFGGLGALTGLGPMGALGGAGAGAGSSASGGAAAGGAGGAGGAGAAGAAGAGAAGSGGIPFLSMAPGAMEASIAASSALSPAAMNTLMAQQIAALPAISAGGLAAGAAPAAIFNAAKDSQLANAAMQAAGTPTGAALVPNGVNLVNAGGVMTTGAGGGWGVLDPLVGAADKLIGNAKDAVAGVVGDKGADLLWNLGKGAIGSALAGKAADALAPKVDTSAVTAQANFANDIAKRQMDLAEKQYADQQALLAQYSPMIQEMIRGQITDQGLSRERSTAQWNDYTNVWRPTELAFNRQSMDFANPARYQQEADRAGVDAATQFDRAKQAQVRQLQMSGASPERIAALTAAGDILAARGTAGARSQAFRDAEMKGLNVLHGAASFGRNMPSTGIQTAALAGQQGQQGMAGVQGLSSLSAAPATIASNLMSRSLNAGDTATQSLLQAQNMGLQAANQRNTIFGDILGAGLGAIGMSGGLGNFFGGWGKP